MLEEMRERTKVFLFTVFDAYGAGCKSVFLNKVVPRPPSVSEQRNGVRRGHVKTVLLGRNYDILFCRLSTGV